MQTPFGEIRVVDAHAHLFSHRFFESLAASLPEPPAGKTRRDVVSEKLPFELPPEDPEILAERWMRELDRHGVARTVLIASVPGDEDSVAAAHRAYPDRVIPYFMLNPKAEGALDRAKRAFRELGFKGLCLFPAMHHFHLWEKELRPVLEEAADRSAVVFVHMGLLKVGVRDKLGLPSPFDLRFANPVDVAGVARAFPSTPFLLPHFGCGFFRELLLVGSECPNVYTDTSSSNSWMAKLPEPMTLARVFERSLDVLGSERILYGSDSSFFPRGFVREQFDAQAQALVKLAVGHETAARILGGNLERLLA